MLLEADIQFVLTTVILFDPGRHFSRKGVPAMLRGTPDMNSLVTVGTTAAWGYSVVATFAPQVLPVGTANVYFKAAAVIVTLILLDPLSGSKVQWSAPPRRSSGWSGYSPGPRASSVTAKRLKGRCRMFIPATSSRSARASRCLSMAKWSRVRPMGGC